MQPYQVRTVDGKTLELAMHERTNPNRTLRIYNYFLNVFKKRFLFSF